jgi:hypothetical protein
LPPARATVPPWLPAKSARVSNLPACCALGPPASRPSTLAAVNLAPAARQGLPVRLDRAPQRGAAFAITRASRRARPRSIGSRSRARGLQSLGRRAEPIQIRSTPPHFGTEHLDSDRCSVHPKNLTVATAPATIKAILANSNNT